METTPELLETSVIKNNFDSLSDQTTDLMFDILPYALAVMAASWGVRKVVGFFKGTAR